jgi:hypothetical protein
MRYATTPTWVPVMLTVMGVGFIGGGIAFVLTAPGAGMVLGPIWLVMGGAFVFFSVRSMRGRRDDERIRSEGIRATATLLSAKTTGWVVNSVPQWALRLRIEGAGAPYEATLKLQTYNPPPNGAAMAVRVDPLRRAHIVLADDAVQTDAGEPPIDTADTVRLLAELDQLRSTGALGQAEFDTLKARLLAGGL